MSQQPEESSRRPTLANANLLVMQRNRLILASQQAVNNNLNTNIDSSRPKRNSMQTSDPYINNIAYQPQQTQTQQQPTVKLENTYSLGPNDNQKFNVSRVQRLANDILSTYLQNVKYEPNKCKEMVQILSDEIKSRVKSIIYKRYKVIVQMTIGQMGESAIIASRCLWNPDFDNSCSVQFTNNSIYAVASIYAIYFD